MRRKILLIIAAICAAFLFAYPGKTYSQSLLHDFDFTISNQSFVAYASRATYYSGAGWGTNNSCGLSHCDSLVQILSFNFSSAVTVNRVDIVIDVPMAQNCAFEFANGDPNAGASQATVFQCGVTTGSITGLNLSAGTIWIGIDDAGTGDSSPVGHIQHVLLYGSGSGIPTNTLTPTDTFTPSPFPCGGSLCFTPAAYNPPCTSTPQFTYTPSSTNLAIDSTHIFPTIAPFSTVIFPTPIVSLTPTDGPSSTPTIDTTLFHTDTPVPTGTPGITPTVPCTNLITNTPIASYGEHDIPGGACYRLIPAMSIMVGPLDVDAIGLHIPEIDFVAHPLDFCYVMFVLDISFAGIDLWSWMVIIFNIVLVAFIINIIRNTS